MVAATAATMDAEEYLDRYGVTAYMKDVVTLLLEKMELFVATDATSGTRLLKDAKVRHFKVQGTGYRVQGTWYRVQGQAAKPPKQQRARVHAHVW